MYKKLHWTSRVGGGESRCDIDVPDCVDIAIELPADPENSLPPLTVLVSRGGVTVHCGGKLVAAHLFFDDVAGLGASRLGIPFPAPDALVQVRSTHPSPDDATK